VKIIGSLNVQVLDENDRKKPYIIHVNRVVMAMSQQIREDCDSIFCHHMKMTSKQEWCMRSQERRKERWTNLMNNNSDHIHAQHPPSLVSSSMFSNLVSNSKEDMWELYLSRVLRGKYHS
jgi:hypothetical protein